MSSSRLTHRLFTTTPYLIVLLVTIVANSCAQENPVEARLGDEEVWVGEPTDFEIKLFSPGPFSGVPTFEFPEIARCYILKTRRPTVSSEEVDGKEFLTQKYMFKLMVARPGKIKIPPFKIRFQGKPSFVGDASPMVGITPELQLQCKSLPGTAGNPDVISASDFTIEQQWQPASNTQLKAGEVVRRTLTRKSVGSSAMAFPGLKPPKIEGVRIYVSEPSAEDKFVDGKLISTRIDEIRYQFESGGEFALPSLEFAWWDYNNEALIDTSVEGVGVTVLAPPTNVPESVSPGTLYTSGAIVVGCLSALVLVSAIAYFARTMFWRWWRAWQRPECIAARAIKRHCQKNEPLLAYSSALKWLQLVGGKYPVADLSHSHQFVKDFNALGAFCFGRQQVGTWDGKKLARSFVALNSQIRSQTRTAERENLLPPLNPTSVPSARTPGGEN